MAIHLKYLKNLLLFLFFCYLSRADAATNKLYDPISIYLTWQRSPESTMTINWITLLDHQEDSLQYRQINQKEWIESTGSHNQLPENTPYLMHRIELTDLLSETTYEFRIGSDGAIYKFQTMPAVLKSSIRFVAGGDMYHDDLETLHATNLQAAKTSPLFVLVGGDIAYASNKLADFLPRWSHPLLDHFAGQKFDRWLSWLIAWKEDMVTPAGCLIPILPAIGNHDTIGRFGQTPEQAPFFYSLFAMPGKPGYNVLDFADYMSIFLLDSGHTNLIEGQQSVWLNQSMQQRQNIPHKFALYHVPAYPSVHKMSEEIGTKIRKFWIPSFDTFHLTAAFENHEHAYKRTYPIRKGVITDREGVIYIGDGGWGVKKPRRPRRLNEKWYLAKTASSRHFLVMDIEQDKQTLHAVNSDGIVIDSFAW